MSRKHKSKKVQIQKSALGVSRIWIALLVLVVVANMSLAYWYFFYTPSKRDTIEAVVENIADEGMRSRLTGQVVSEELANSRPFAVVLDNYSVARPQSGVGDAVVVFEMLVEGGVTRLLAVFQNDLDLSIGPVRSAREYMLPLVSALDAVFGHSGGSIMALQQLRNSDIADADEFRFGNTYYRASNRFAPHNLFTNTVSLKSLTEEQSWQEWNIPTQWQFSDDVPTGQIANNIDIQFSTGPYNTRWSYNSQLGSYQRSVGGRGAIDANTKEIVSVKNVVVLYTTVAPAPRVNYPDAVSVDTLGSGEAIFFRNGVAVLGRWSLTERSGLTLIDVNGQSYYLSPGKTWFSFVSADIPDIVSFE